jgi:chromatin remodeling complex protein RSC6
MPESSPIRRKTRRAKDLALDKAIDVLENPGSYDKETYNQTYLTVLKNSVPRTQEITGEEGEAIQAVITGMSIIKDSTGGNPIQDTQSEDA